MPPTIRLDKQNFKVGTGQTLTIFFSSSSSLIDCEGFNDTSIMWVILCCLPGKGRKKNEDLEEEMKERDRKEIEQE